MSAISSVFTKLPTFQNIILSRYAPLPTLVLCELNNPATGNSMAVGLLQDWVAALNFCSSEPTVHAVVVSGRINERASDEKALFCSGASLTGRGVMPDKDGKPAQPRSLQECRTFGTASGSLVDAFIDFPKLLVGAINGHAYGLAVTTASFYDEIFALPGRVFKTPFADIGLCAEGCSSKLFPEILGPSLTARLLYYSDEVKAEELLPSGFVSEVVPPSQADARTLPSYVLSRLADRLGVPRDPTDALKPGGYTKLSYASILRSKALRRDQLARAELHKLNRKEMEQVAQIMASEEFPMGVLRFATRQAEKKRAAREAAASKL
ncbi:Enoyl-CoA delta isomerase 2, mitochondrial [Tilletia horrida]|uniref:Enoyl-CoA delta isomerase 2, mitochondrial n=1 Tax=Tilletia horrida TaxID=155126 RepID=A0AAN6GKC4_9BASI|nr:Enoyl-CoA delta isomerase 2, mitochondrial [Tilletia horrida]KAK0541076.1 Enoyl-CoA delta isomerase 2, mitochondrial [Tilletia horrida]